MYTQKSRDRQFSNTRLSYSRHLPHSTERPSLSPSHQASRHIEQPQKDTKLCVNCYNNQLSADKHTKRMASEAEKAEKGQALTLSKLSRDGGKEKDQYKNEVQKVNQFNLKKIQQNQRKKTEELQKKREEKPTQQQLALMKDMDERKMIEDQRRNKLRQDLEKQITFAKQRREQQAQESRNSVPSPIIGKTSNDRDRQMIENSYKQQLLKQINQKKNKKIQEEEAIKSNDQENTLYFVKNADIKRKEAQILEANFKESVRNEMQRKMEAQQQRREIAAKQREKETMDRINKERQMKGLTYQKQNERREKIERYIQDLKKQMQVNAIKRNEEFKWLGQKSDACILGPKAQPNIQPCTCCKKEVPTRQLSPYIRQLKRQ